MNVDEKTCPRCAETIKRAALVCRFCGHEFPAPAVRQTAATPSSRPGDPAPSTWLPPRPDAGVKAVSNSKVFGYVGLGCLGLFVLLALIGALAGGDASTSPDNVTAVDNTMVEADAALDNAAAAIEEVEIPAEPASGWAVSSRKDEIRNRTVDQASITSTNQVQFDFPYNSGSTLSITVRKHPQYGEDVIFQISDGQFLCGIYDCSGMISIDGKSESLTLVPPEDHDSKTLFAKYGSGIIAKLKGSEKVIVELPFYQEGNRQFTFETHGLVWPPKG